MELHILDKNPDSPIPIWAINTADAHEVVRAAGDIILTVPRLNGAGQPDILKVRQTWLPQNLTELVPRRQLLACTEFRRAVNSGLITLIRGSKAKALLRNDGANEERQRLRDIERHVRDAGAARTIADSGAEITRADGQTDDDKPTIIGGDDVAKLAARGVADVESGITPNFKMFATRLLAGSDIEAKNAIRNRRSFTKKELGYLSRMLPKTFKLTSALLQQHIK